MIAKVEQLVTIPGLDEPVSLQLSPELDALREKALTVQHAGWNYWAMQLGSIEAEVAAWKLHTDDEDWRIWRARRFTAKAALCPSNRFVLLL